MSPIARSAALLASLLLASACGELTNQDLLFLAAVPKAKDLALEVNQGQDAPGRTVGAPAEYYQLVLAGATSINGGVGSILDFVDQLGKGYPPTTRTEDRRIWGPVTNLNGSGVTLRLEIARAVSDDSVTYSYCLHTGRDTSVTQEVAEVTCADLAKGGLEAVLYGNYRPSRDEGGARTGTGELTLDFEASLRTGLGKPEDRGVIAFTYDFAREDSGEKTIDLTIDKPQLGLEPPAHASYSYDRDAAGAVYFYLQFPEYADDTGPLRETVTIEACWTEGGIGRADVSLADGELASVQPVNATECWDEATLRTYLRYTYSTTTSEEGNATTCRAACARP